MFQYFQQLCVKGGHKCRKKEKLLVKGHPFVLMAELGRGPRFPLNHVPVLLLCVLVLE